MALTAWRIDAWAVRDGAAFASRREAESRTAENTVFIAIPDLEPVPVGRLSTALSATRRNFQTGLRDLEGGEIAFQSLEQIQELVRRGFLAAGLGPAGGAAPSPGGRPPSPDDGRGEGLGGEDGGEERGETGPRPGGAGHYQQAIDSSETRSWQWCSPQHGAPQALERIAEAAVAKPMDASEASPTIAPLFSLLAAYAESITLDWEQRIERQPDPHDFKRLMDWYQALCEVGVWADLAGLYGFVNEHRCPVGLRLFDRWQFPWSGPWFSDADRLPRQHLLSHAPCPRLLHWAPGLSRFSDKVVLPACVGNYFDENCFLPELAPCVLGALLLTSGGFPQSLLSGDQFRRARLAVALRWVAHEVPPMASLPDVADDLLNAYAWRQLEGLHQEVY